MLWLQRFTAPVMEQMFPAILLCQLLLNTSEAMVCYVNFCYNCFCKSAAWR